MFAEHTEYHNMIPYITTMTSHSTRRYKYSYKKIVEWRNLKDYKQLLGFHSPKGLLKFPLHAVKNKNRKLEDELFIQ